MNKPLVFMLSGQGSQYYQMGKELFNCDLTFRNTMLKLDAIVVKFGGKSAVDAIYHPDKLKSDVMDALHLSHPALFMVQYALYSTLLEKNISPDYLLGFSLGEFIAATIAGVFTIEEAIESLLQQAALCARTCDRGGMIAVLANSKLYDQTPELYQHSEFVSQNYDSHFVIAGKWEPLERIRKYLKERGVLHQFLPVNYGFHSKEIDPMLLNFNSLMRKQTFSSPTHPIVSCLLGDVVSEISSDYFWQIMRRPFHFQKTIQNLESRDECVYVDLGPSGTCANFAKQILPKNANRCHHIMTPFGQELRNLEILAKSLSQND